VIQLGGLLFVIAQGAAIFATAFIAAHILLAAWMAWPVMSRDL
jgi:hypothetical protein